jgi:hypothetical protein
MGFVDYYYYYYCSSNSSRFFFFFFALTSVNLTKGIIHTVGLHKKNWSKDLTIMHKSF